MEQIVSYSVEWTKDTFYIIFEDADGMGEALQFDEDNMERVVDALTCALIEFREQKYE